MSQHTAITVNRSRDEVERLWSDATYHPDEVGDAAVTFKDAPGDRGTEIHVTVEKSGILPGGGAQAKVRDGLRRFKARVETGIIPRSDGVPEGELAERKLKQRPAQPLEADELEKAGLS